MQETLIVGWCENCICRYEYHLGDDAGTCLNCNCTSYKQHEDSDILDRIKGNILGLLEDEDIDLEALEEEEEAQEQERSVVVPVEYEVFMGKAIRGCKGCGKLKVYRYFVERDNPDAHCTYCIWEEGEEALLEDTADLEDSIIESEIAYYDALDRQEAIDEFLRGLDE